MIPNELMESLSQFGVAGLMGVLWVWERYHSRKREQQLSQTHERLMQQREAVGTLIALVKHNTDAFNKFSQTQDRLNRLLEQLRERLRGDRAA